MLCGYALSLLVRKKKNDVEHTGICWIIWTSSLTKTKMTTRISFLINQHAFEFGLKETKIVGLE